jgi:hypothetical protein
MSEQLRVCIDKVLPRKLQPEAELRAMEENPANTPRPGEAGTERLEIAVLRRKLWKPGRVLRVRFLDGIAGVQDKVAAKAKEWEQYVNIHFEFGDDPEAEIRISFTPDGSWSYMGTDAFFAPAVEQTMNFGWLDEFSSDDEISRVVLHEFGHALGAIHEHQHPEAGFEWNEEAVLKYYMGPPNNWTEEEVRFNVLDRYSRDVSQYSEFDTNSIMLYPIPKRFTLGGFEVPWSNTVLSETDKQFMSTVYPCDPATSGC